MGRDDRRGGAALSAHLRAGGSLSASAWFGCVAGGSFALPAIAAMHQRVVAAPLRVIAFYCGLGFLQSAYIIALSFRGTTNLWVIHLFVPVQATMFLWALSLWQARERDRIMVLMIIPLFLAAWLSLTLAVESFSGLPRYVKVVEGLLIIAVASYTLVVRSQHITDPVTNHAWFWVSSALVMYLAFGAIIAPISSLLLPRAPGLVVRIYLVNSVLLVVCNLLFARAMFGAAPRTARMDETPAPAR